MKEYLNYLFNNLKNGNYTTGILIILTLLIYIFLLCFGIKINNKFICILAVLSLIFGTAICISWNNYYYDKKQ